MFLKELKLFILPADQLKTSWKCVAKFQRGFQFPSSWKVFFGCTGLGVCRCKGLGTWCPNVNQATSPVRPCVCHTHQGCGVSLMISDSKQLLSSLALCFFLLEGPSDQGYVYCDNGRSFSSSLDCLSRRYRCPWAIKATHNTVTSLRCPSYPRSKARERQATMGSSKTSIEIMHECLTIQDCEAWRGSKIRLRQGRRGGTLGLFLLFLFLFVLLGLFCRLWESSGALAKLLSLKVLSGSCKLKNKDSPPDGAAKCWRD